MFVDKETTLEKESKRERIGRENDSCIDRQKERKGEMSRKRERKKK